MMRIDWHTTMQVLHARDPRYGFDRHKGYATSEHLAQMRRTLSQVRGEPDTARKRGTSDDPGRG